MKRVEKLPQVGLYIRDERKSQGLSQTQLSDLAGVSLNFVSQLEAGKPTVRLDKLMAILNALGLQLCMAYNQVEARVESE